MVAENMGDPLGGVVHDAASFAAARSRREAGTRWSGGRAAAIGWRKSATPPALRLVVPDQLSGLERVVEIADGNQPLAPANRPRAVPAHGIRGASTSTEEGAALMATGSGGPVAHGANLGSTVRSRTTRSRAAAWR